MAAKEKEISPYAQKIMWDWITSRYDLKRDVIKSRVLWKEKNDKKNNWRVMRPEKLNTIAIDVSQAMQKNCSVATIKQHLYSELTPEFNPVIEYLDKVGKKGKTGIISKFCKSVQTDKPERFEKYFTKWLVASVANAMIPDGCQNAMCLTFTGEQGRGKSRFFKYLCPAELADYMFTGELDLKQKKDAHWKLAEYWLVNIEEQLLQLNKYDHNAMKTLISLPEIKGRRPYAEFDTQATRIANIMASTNDAAFLTDPTGSRRFICILALAFLEKDYRKINIDDVWSEAVTIFKKGDFEYWMNNDEINEMNDYNFRFQVVSQELEYISLYVTAPTKQEPATHAIPATILRDFITAETGNKTLREVAIGRALKQIGCEQQSQRFFWINYPIRVWMIRLLEPTGNAILNKYALENNPQDQGSDTQP